MLNNKTETEIYYWFCTLIIYSMIFWTLLNSILCILFAAYWIIFSKKHFNLHSLRSRLMLLFVSFYLVGIISMIYSHNMAFALMKIGRQSPLLLFPVIFGTTRVIIPDQVKKLSLHLIAATGLACLAGIFYGIYHSLVSGNAEWVTGESILIFYDLRGPYMGIFCLLSVCVAMDRLTDKKSRQRNWLILSVLVSSVMILLLGNRLMVICWLLIMIYYSWKKMKPALSRLVASFSIILTILLGILFLPRLSRQWKELKEIGSGHTIMLDRDSSLGGNWGGINLRLAIWKCSLDIVKGNWLIGVGTGDVQEALQRSYENRKFYFASRYNRYNAHNQYLQIWMASGLAALLLYLGSLFIPLLMYRRYFAGELYLIFLLVMIATGISESLLDANKGILSYSFFNSIFAFALLRDSAESTDRKP